MDLFGRRKIYTAQEVNQETVVSILNNALAMHFQNFFEEDYLDWYRRGRQPILNRVKEIRPEINNKVTQNIATSIVAFKNGYFMTQPAFYRARTTVDEADIAKLNNYLYLSGKHIVDNDVIDDFHTMGLGCMYVEAGDEEVPVKVHSIDPRQGFVVYSRRPGNEPVMGVNIVIQTREENASYAVFDVFTQDTIYHIGGGLVIPSTTDSPNIAVNGMNLLSVEPNNLGMIPLIEYQYDRQRMSAFESVLGLLDAMNTVQSNRLDAVEQFVQSLMVFYNCELGTDDDGEPLTPQKIRQYGAVFLKSIGQNPADLKILNEQLNQGQTQVYIDNLFYMICNICGVPFTVNSGASTSDNVGAVYLKNGWETADTYVRNTQDLFLKSNRYFDELFLKIVKYKTKLDIKPSDIELIIPRNETDNLLVKTQAAMNMQTLGLAPSIWLTRSGLSSDPVSDIAVSKEYLDAKRETDTNGNSSSGIGTGTGSAVIG